MITHNLCFKQYIHVEKVILTTVNQIYTRLKWCLSGS